MSFSIDVLAQHNLEEGTRLKFGGRLLMMRLILCGAILAAAGCATQPAASEPPQTPPSDNSNLLDVDADLSQIMTAYAAPSLSVAVIKDGDIIYANAFGFENLASNKSAGPQSQYAIGSVVKTFTSALFGSLERDGLVDLKAHPSVYLEGLKLRGDDLDENLKLSNLLSQTSGLPDISGSLAFFPTEEQIELMPRLPQFSASCRVGDCWQYNNFNFIMLDAIAESVTGKSKNQLLSERLFQPAGLENTLNSTSAFSQSDDAATGYAQVEGAPVETAIEYVYGEHVYATASDLARWLDVWMSEGADLFTAEYAKRAISMQAISDGSPPTSDDPSSYMSAYGYGWRIRSRDGHYQVEHGGNENGFSTQVLFVPAERVGVVAMTNQQNSILPYIANDILLRQMLSQEPMAVEDYPVVVHQAAAFLEPEEVELVLNSDAPPSLNPASLVGHYYAEGYGEVEVAYTNSVLTLTTPAARFILIHKEDEKYGLATTQPVPLGINIEFFEITFNQDSLRANFAAEPVVFSKVPS